MGILDNINKKYNPLQKAADALNAAVPKPKPVETKTPQQAAYEAKTDAMNSQNPYYKPGDAVPRAKGGRVKAGGCPMKNVDNSGLTKEHIK